jgi:cytochrome c553
MTKPQIWLASFLFLFILLFVLQKMTRGPRDDNKPLNNPSSQGEMSNQSQNMAPKDLVARLGCTGCHGSELEGTKMAPALANLKEYWSKEKLINYLRNPSSFMDSDRFKAYRDKYPGTIMPSFDNINVQDLGKIAEFLLMK